MAKAKRKRRRTHRRLHSQPPPPPRKYKSADLDKLINKLGHACSMQRSDIVLNAIGNPLVFEIAHRLDTERHQAAIDMPALQITEGLQR